MNQEKLNRLALELMHLGISQAGAAELMASAPIEEIERQLLYLPHRKAKRPGAFLIEAVRRNYSPPKEFFYAETQAHPASARSTVDENPSCTGRSPDADVEGHRTTGASGSAPASTVPEALSAQAIDLVLPVLDREDWSSIRGDK